MASNAALVAWLNQTRGAFDSTPLVIPNHLLFGALFNETPLAYSPMRYNMANLTGTADIRNQQLKVSAEVSRNFWMNTLASNRSWTVEDNQERFTTFVEFAESLVEGWTVSVELGGGNYPNKRIEWSPEASPSGLYSDWCCESEEDLRRLRMGDYLWLAPKCLGEPLGVGMLVAVIKVVSVTPTHVVGRVVNYSSRHEVKISLAFLKTFMRTGGMALGCRIPRRAGQSVLASKAEVLVGRRLVSYNHIARRRYPVEIEAGEKRLEMMGNFGTHALPTSPCLEPVEIGWIIPR